MKTRIQTLILVFLFCVCALGVGGRGLDECGAAATRLMPTSSGSSPIATEQRVGHFRQLKTSNNGDDFPLWAIFIIAIASAVACCVLCSQNGAIEFLQIAAGGTGAGLQYHQVGAQGGNPTHWDGGQDGDHHEFSEGDEEFGMEGENEEGLGEPDEDDGDLGVGYTGGPSKRKSGRMRTAGLHGARALQGEQLPADLELGALAVAGSTTTVTAGLAVAVEAGEGSISAVRMNQGDQEENDGDLGAGGEQRWVEA